MLQPPRHTPYDGSARLFEIGGRPLDMARWLDVDAASLPAYLAQKAALLETRRDEVFVAEPETEAAQAEARDLVVSHLIAQHPGVYRRDGEVVEVVPAGRRVRLDTGPPLLAAAGLVAEDLLLMRRSTAGWRLAAASLSFPSSWSLGEKFGRPIEEIHQPVPGFGAGSRPAQLIARMFDGMRPEMGMLRWNWSVYDNDRLFHPESAEPGSRRFGDGARAENVFLRVERQTLRKLPASGDILFTIGVVVDPLAALEAHPEAGRIATALAAQLGALDPAQLAYKGLAAERDRLIARLATIAGPA